jgi:hypothetical protein
VPQAAWHVVEGGKAAGPYGLDMLRRRIAAGSLTRDSLVWREGMAEWARAGEVEALSPLFAAVPPPIPGA